MESSLIPYALTILSKEYQKLENDEDIGASVGLVDDNDLFVWSVIFQGPTDTDYESGFYKAILTFPENYPSHPPEMKFVTEMWHPNIYPDGKVCISILHPPGEDEHNQQESSEERWRPILGVESIILSVISMLNDPNIESPANLDASVQYKEDRKQYRRKVRRLAIKSVENME